MPKGPSGQKRPALVLALFVIASPVLAEPAAEKAPARDEKPIIYYGPGLDSFSPPSPVIVGGTSGTPLPSAEKPEKPKPAPKKALGNA